MSRSLTATAIGVVLKGCWCVCFIGQTTISFAAEERIVCRVDGNPLTARDLTLLNEREVTQVIESCRFAFEQSQSYFVPAIRGAEHNAADAKAAYTRYLEGVLFRYIVSLVLDDIAKHEKRQIQLVRQ